MRHHLSAGFALIALWSSSSPLAAAEWQAKAVFITEARIAALRERVEKRQEPTWTAWQRVKKLADDGLTATVEVPQRWHVPGAYKDPEGCTRANRPIDLSANTGYCLALAYRITGEDRYAKAAVGLITPWSTGIRSYSKKEDSTLSFSYHVPAMIAAADLLRRAPQFPPTDQELFRTFVREQALPMNCMARKNNWGNWGTLLVLTSAAYLNDRTVFDSGIKRWKALLESQQDDAGTLTEEVKRSEGKMGLWYTNFCLFAQTLGAEVARINGVDLYTYTSPTGRSLRKAFEHAIPWQKDPASFPFFKGDPKTLVGVLHIPHFELLVPRWQNPDAAALLQRARPTATHFGIPAETFTHGDLPVDL